MQVKLNLFMEKLPINLLSETKSKTFDIFLIDYLRKIL